MAVVDALSFIPGCFSGVVAMSKRLGVILVGPESRVRSSRSGKWGPIPAEAIGMGLSEWWCPGKGGGEEIPGLEFEPQRLESGDTFV